jgi:putative sigma-54 modulation protein
MRLELRTPGVEVGERFEQRLDRKLQLALSRFARVVRRVFVTVSDENGPKGGPDKTCRLRLVTDIGPAIVIERTETSAERAVDVAVDRAVQSVARQLSKQRVPRRRMRTLTELARSRT